ncbi:MSMEG_0569 family flavin-dependent oxidoreductase [Pseudomonas sp. 10B1]|uniref:MSMEG_0569 family flavin-dependent oxidoreductase n=1 Tax=unclassified Pseudomonas TaxID=196821 RepID=UPI002AB3D8CF|nr:MULTISPECIES: MSMEG_0569 family flavin-dependent oxidoreductase [unclassified Pseudomonas]MDY7559680.1 MSMEG_0569 family flavin-dependent oxidoreductase [Pseudomonas sp. AB6]MEA9993084.1 MSMEG_0569 family flavin-dependent oxidoreductase [Pseudomonas sp. AA4]MEB0086026.1 MSMEG_0569 family flavin-dependent oxidoreductase [Pseudomonas sp. RTI1]MEB0125538.1 MSMEG_0569 family flavin-dependent oxidoreductase [Pseudomonas sp. CCC1.2]MEB0151669.1 MSMEG_0569 family flavin-dependent oxidoreductase [P
MVQLTSVKPAHHSVIVVGGGQAGLSASYYLQQQGIDHLLLEKHSVTHAWRHQRWDAFSLVTPNWQCALPGYTYSDQFKGQDPHGFMKRDEINTYLAGFAQSVNAPLLEGVTVQRVVPRASGGYDLHTSQGEYTADKVIVASGGYHTPIIPRLAERLPAGIQQIHSEQYRNPQALPAGNVLVVGSGQSGAQIAEDLHLAGRKVYLAVGDAPRCARFYRGKDVVDWLAQMGYYDIGVDTHPLREGVRDNTNHYVTGRDGGRDIDLRQFANEGMELFGRLEGLNGVWLQFASNLSESLDSADAVYNRINTTIDGYIEKNAIDAPAGEFYSPVWTPEQERAELDLEAHGITSIIWCIGFTPDFTWVEAPVFNGRGHPGHQRGVTTQPGLYFLGLPWLYTWGSGRFSGVARDAEYLVEHIAGVAEEKREARLSLAR